MDFEKALAYMKDGSAIARESWDNKFLFLTKGFADVKASPISDCEGTRFNGIPKWMFGPPVKEGEIIMPTIIITGVGINEAWQADPQDLLSEDWTRLAVSRIKVIMGMDECKRWHEMVE